MRNIKLRILQEITTDGFIDCIDVSNLINIHNYLIKYEMLVKSNLNKCFDIDEVKFNEHSTMFVDNIELSIKPSINDIVLSNYLFFDNYLNTPIILNNLTNKIFIKRYKITKTYTWKLHNLYEFLFSDAWLINNRDVDKIFTGLLNRIHYIVELLINKDIYELLYILHTINKSRFNNNNLINQINSHDNSLTNLNIIEQIIYSLGINVGLMFKLNDTNYELQYIELLDVDNYLFRVIAKDSTFLRNFTTKQIYYSFLESETISVNNVNDSSLKLIINL